MRYSWLLRGRGGGAHRPQPALMEAVAGDAGRLGPQSGMFGAMACQAIFDPGDQHRAAGFGASGGMALLALDRDVLGMIEPRLRQKAVAQYPSGHDPPPPPTR